MTDNPMINTAAGEAPAGMFAAFVPLIRAADGLTLGQVCSLSALEPTTVQNWIKRGFVPHPERKKYYERHLARVKLIADLRECMPIERIGELLRYINGDADDVDDDIITEERLYDLFHDITREIESVDPAPDRVGEIVERHTARYLSDTRGAQRVSRALHIMTIAYMAGRLKLEADRLYKEL